MVAVLDLYCGAGLAARGLYRAGATEVYGVDINPQRRYAAGGRPKAQRFTQLDITSARERDFVLALGRECDFVWASPPCQFGSAMRHAPNAKKHKNLIPFTRELLQEIGKPYVIENVEGAREHLRDPVTLDGAMFDLGTWLHLPGDEWSGFFQLERRRCFETSWKMRQPRAAQWDGPRVPTIGVYGSHARVRAASVPGGRGTSWPFVQKQNYAAADALGVAGEGLTLAEMSQGIPPAYSAHILKSWKRSRK